MAASVPNPGSFMGELAIMFTVIRDRLQEVQDKDGYIAAMGGSSFLTAAPPDGMGLSAGDAAALIASLGNMTTLSKAYQGGPAAPVLDYKSNTMPFWGGL